MDRNLTPRPNRRKRKKKLPLSARILRFIFGRPMRLTLLSLFILAVTALIGFAVFTAVCRNDTPWQEIPSPENETIPPLEDSPLAPLGDGFAADLSGFEDYINPIGDKRDVFLRLVSKKLTLKRGDAPSDLSEIPSEYTHEGKRIELSLYAAKALEAMLIEMETLGIPMTDTQTGLPIRVLTGYRSYDELNALFQKEVERQMKKDPTLTREMAEDLASINVIVPGTDEHQSGLAVSFAVGNAVGASFGDTDAYRWLSENAWKFGFVIRYPEGKLNATGVPFRPYHFRYVGRAHAKLMKENNLCLEEYLRVVILE